MANTSTNNAVTASGYTPSYEDFEKELAASGLAGQFGAADLATARENPSYGMTILNYKKDWNNATTAEEKAAINRAAEEYRQSMGGYSGGADGSGYYENLLSPRSYDYTPYESQYGDLTQNLLNQQLNYGSYDYGVAQPTYTNEYKDRIDNKLNDITNREDFSYNAQDDDLYKQYRKQYIREGQRATQDAMGAAAAAQAGNYYSAQLTDKIPELYQIAYDKYLNDYQMDVSDLNAIMGVEQSEYDKYLNKLNQWNTDRNFDYNAWYDGYNMINNNLNTVQNLDNTDYSRWQYDNEFKYGQLKDEVANQASLRDEDWNIAQIKAAYGDYSGLNDLGVNTDNYLSDSDQARFEQLYNLAALTEDVSVVNKLLGTNYTQEQWWQFRNSQALAEAGKYGSVTSGTGGGTGSSSGSSGSGGSSSRSSSSGSSSGESSSRSSSTGSSSGESKVMNQSYFSAAMTGMVSSLKMGNVDSAAKAAEQILSKTNDPDQVATVKRVLAQYGLEYQE